MTVLVDIAEAEFGLVTPAKPTVYVKPTWQHQWSEARELTCQRCTFSIGSQDSEAILRGHYGDITPAGVQGHTIFAPTNYDRWFVKVEFPTRNPVGTKVWYGIIVSSTDTRFGDNSQGAYGDQFYQAYGLEWFLHRHQVLESTLVRTDGTSYRINRGLLFNGGASRQGRDIDIRFRNRSVTFGPKGVYGYVDRLMDGQEWTAFQMLEYLVEYHQPWATGLKWGLGDVFDSAGLSWHKPRGIETHGRTLRQIVDQIVDIRRGLIYWWEFSDITDTLLLNIATNVAAPISLPSEGTLPENPSVLTVAMNTRRRSPITYRNDTSPRYQQIICQGAYRTFTRSLQIMNGTLEPDWTSEQRNAYKAGAINSPGYAALQPAEKESLNDIYRQSDPLRRVWTRYRVPDDAWAALAIDPTTAQSVWVDGLQLSLLTPLIDGLDYTTPASPVPITGSEQTGDYLDNLCFIQVATGQYLPIANLGVLSRNEKYGHNGLNFSVTVRPYDSGPGLVIQPNAPSHVIAGPDWSQQSDAPSAHRQVLDYRTLVVTATIQLDDRVTERWPETSSVQVSNQSAKHVINLGDDVRQDFIRAGTPIGLTDVGDLKTTQASGWIRDDSQYAKDVARLAYEWYQTERQSVRFDVGYLMGEIVVGNLISILVFQFSAAAINSLVTAVTYDFDHQSTTIDTDRGEELDFRALAVR